MVYRAWLHFSACSCDVLYSIMLKIKYMGGKGPLQGVNSKELTARSGQQGDAYNLAERGQPYGAAQCCAWDWTS